jgi:hypothetical protein
VDPIMNTRIKKNSFEGLYAVKKKREKKKEAKKK